MARHKKTTVRKVTPISPMEFVGAQMANTLYAIANDSGVPADTRARAKQLQLKWDSISRFQLNNPIVAAELEAKLFPRVGQVIRQRP